VNAEFEIQFRIPYSLIQIKMIIWFFNRLSDAHSQIQAQDFSDVPDRIMKFGNHATFCAIDVTQPVNNFDAQSGQVF
jgi:hypothetical protein